MKTWIVTGGAASGKSLLCQTLGEIVPCSAFFGSDETVHSLLARPDVIALLSAEFGPGVLDSDGCVNRSALREVVFTDAGARSKLEAILHPLVFEALMTRHDALVRGRKSELLIAEVPLFYESCATFPADLVIVVATGATLQQERLTGLRGLDQSTAERIRSAQWPLSRKLESADKVVWNEGNRALLTLQAQILVQQLDPP